MPVRPGSKLGRTRLAGSVALVALLAAGSASCSGGSSSGEKANAATTFAAALQLQKAGHLNQAKQLYQQVVKASPTNYYAYYDLGVIAQRQGDTSLALQDYGAAITAKSTFVPAMFNEGTIYRQSNPALAITTFKRVIKLQPTAPTAYLSLGLLEVKHGRPKQGVADLVTAVRQDGSLLSQVPKHLRLLVTSLVSPPTPSATATPSTSPTITPTS